MLIDNWWQPKPGNNLLQSANKGKEEDCTLTNMEINDKIK